MKVYVLMWRDATPYQGEIGVHSVYSTRKAAEDYLKKVGNGPHEQCLNKHDYGYYLRPSVSEFEVDV